MDEFYKEVKADIADFAVDFECDYLTVKENGKENGKEIKSLADLYSIL